MMDVLLCTYRVVHHLRPLGNFGWVNFETLVLHCPIPLVHTIYDTVQEIYRIGTEACNGIVKFKAN